MIVFLEAVQGFGYEVAPVRPLTDRVLVVEVRDGRVVRETLGHGDNGKIDEKALDVSKAERATAYQVRDVGTKRDVKVLSVRRKSKGTQFVRVAEWELGHVMTHWFYVTLAEPMERGKRYTFKADFMETKLVSFDEASVRSEAVQVNQLGFRGDIKPKYAYMSHWMGSGGGLDLSDYAQKRFHVVNAETKKVVYSGKPKLRLAKGGREDAYDSNYRLSDLWELDFSDFDEPGKYRIMMEGVGTSFPFRIGNDVYEEAYRTTMRGLYHQRCGCVLDKKHTKWARARCHHPEDTPVILSKHRVTDGGDHFKALPAQATGRKLQAWGGYHDAGDWDRRAIHLSIADALLYAYEVEPTAFPDKQLSLPESGNGRSDLLDEVRYNVDLFRRLQQKDGGVCGGIESEEHPKFGEASWTDTLHLYAFAPDAESTLRYAATAAHLGRLLGEKDPGYLNSAKRAWTWAMAQPEPDGDFALHAAIALYRATGEKAYHAAFENALIIEKSGQALLSHKKYDQRWGVWHYAVTNEHPVDRKLHALLRSATVKDAEALVLETGKKKGRRQGFDWYQPFGHGSLTTPRNLPLMAAHRVTGDARFLEQMALNADAALGNNALNICWVTGLGSRPCQAVLHLDSFYDGVPAPIPGIVPYGPMRPLKEPGWTHAWGPKTLYPGANIWPCEEGWTGNVYSPVAAEFTVHENIGPAAAAYAYLAFVR